MKNTILLPLLIACLLISTALQSKTIIIGNSGDFANLSEASNSVEAGDTLLLQDQIFQDGAQFLNNWVGTAEHPIVIMAENQHLAILRGGSEAIHLVRCMHIELNGLVFERQTGNGVNIDDGGLFDQPSKHVTVRNCIFRDMNARGNNDLLKMSGIDSFLIEKCDFINGGAGGSGIDFVGCHHGTIQDCKFDNAGSSGVQHKGGTQYIRVQRCTFKNISQRALNLGGSTSLQFFRPPLPNTIVDAFEAADLEIYSNIFIGCLAPIAYVGCVRVKVHNNTFYNPENWVIRILQETTEDGFLTCADNEFINNIVYLDDDIREVNIGPNTNPGSFIFSNNLWFNASDNNWSPTLPVQDVNQVISDPIFINAGRENFDITSASPAIKAGLFIDATLTDYNIKNYYNPPSIGAFEGYDIPTNSINLTQKSIKLFPNPSFEDQVSISGISSDSKVIIFDVTGKLLKNITISNTSESTTIHNIPKGVYFIHINQKQGINIVKKLIRF